MDLIQYRELFLTYLEKHPFEKSPFKLYEPVDYILSIGGKRMRPILTLMSCELFGAAPDRALDAAMAVEVFHNFTLLHDDIMDDAPLRRSHKTVHEKWDVNTAILSGDVMMIQSYEFLLKYEGPELAKLLRVFNTTAIEVCEGQQMDVDFESLTEVPLDSYLEMIKLKTSVLVACALKMGAIIAGADDNNAQLIYDFGLNLGLAFQLQDDYLDAFGDPKTFGKQVGGDIIENKKTFLYIEGLKMANAQQKVDLLNYFSSTDMAQDLKVSEVKKLFKEIGVDQAILEEIQNYTSKALKILDDLTMSDSSKKSLNEFANYLMKRSV